LNVNQRKQALNNESKTGNESTNEDDSQVCKYYPPIRVSRVTDTGCRFPEFRKRDKEAAWKRIVTDSRVPAAASAIRLRSQLSNCLLLLSRLGVFLKCVMVYCDNAKGRQKFVEGNIYDEFANRNR
jgi:hypothetical protein